MQSGRIDCVHVVNTGLDGVDGPLTASVCQSWVVDNTNRREPSMKEVTTIGLDLAKAVFQVHGVDAVGAVTPDLDSRTGFRHREWQKCWRLINPGRKCGAKL